MKQIAIIVVGAFLALTLSSQAGATPQFLPHGTHLTVNQKVTYFERSIHKDKTAIAFLHNHRRLAGVNRVMRWYKAALKWHTSLLQRYSAKLAPPPVVRTSSGGYTGLQRIGYANPYCESGGDPYNKHNPKYRGKWQFDQGTWDAYAPRGWRGVDPANAPESVQDQAALNVPYDAWPNC